MLSTYEIVASAFSLLVCQAQNTPCSLRKSLHSCHSILLIVKVILPKSQRTHRRKMIRICLQHCYNIHRNLTFAIPIQKDGLCNQSVFFVDLRIRFMTTTKLRRGRWAESSLKEGCA